MIHILLIEDDIQLSTTIQKYLLLQGYEVTVINDGGVAIDTIDKNNYNLYIIDINIPNVNGLDITKYLRQKDFATPIIIITASLELSNFQEAFSNGCSEYIKKPFYLEELDIRINNLLSKEKNTLLQIDENITYDMEYEELKVNGITMKLRKKERRLLTILLQNCNKTVASETIIDYVWENEIKENYPLRQLMTDLRKHFESDTQYIIAEVGVGYKFAIKN